MVKASSHVMILMFLIYCIQNDIKISESSHNEKLLHSPGIDLGYVHKKWEMKKNLCYIM